MNIDANFINWTVLDITALKTKVLEQSDEDWAQEPFRQKAYAAHRDTESIYLLFDRDFRHERPTAQPRYAEFKEPLESLFDRLAAFYRDGGSPIRCLLARLSVGGAILPHVDTGFSLMHAHRLHVPIVSNDKAFFSVGGVEVCMKAGEVWEINNAREHSARNDGPAPRVHLIVDWAPPLSVTARAEYDAVLSKNSVEPRRLPDRSN